MFQKMFCAFATVTITAPDAAHLARAVRNLKGPHARWAAADPVGLLVPRGAEPRHTHQGHLAWWVNGECEGGGEASTWIALACHVQAETQKEAEETVRDRLAEDLLGPDLAHTLDGHTHPSQPTAPIAVEVFETREVEEAVLIRFAAARCSAPPEAFIRFGLIPIARGSMGIRIPLNLDPSGEAVKGYQPYRIGQQYAGERRPLQGAYWKSASGKSSALAIQLPNGKWRLGAKGPYAA